MTKTLTAVKEARRAWVSSLLDEFGQTQLAEKTGVPASYLWQMGKGEGTQRRGVSDENLEKIERGIGRRLPGASQESQPTRLDPAMLASSIEALRRVAKSQGLPYDEVTHAVETALTYELACALGAAPSTSQVIDFGAKVAELLRQREDAGNGRATGKSTGRTDSGRAATKRPG